MTSTPEGIPGLHLSTDGPIDAEAGTVVEIPVRLMEEESRLEIPQHARHVRPHHTRR